MKIAILGDRKRYEAYLPPFVHDLPVELTFFSPSAPSRRSWSSPPIPKSSWPTPSPRWGRS